MTGKIEVRHNPAAQRFEALVENQIAVLDYVQHGDTIFFTHTGVPPALTGRGIGSQLVRTGLEYARENAFKVATSCWFVAGYRERHPE